MEKLEGGKKSIRGSSEIENCELSPFSAMIKYSHRGPNLAVFFLRQGIPQMRMKKAEIGLIPVLNRDQLIEGGVIVEKDAGDT